MEAVWEMVGDRMTGAQILQIKAPKQSQNPFISALIDRFHLVRAFCASTTAYESEELSAFLFVTAAPLE